jgi:hypothetical protein
MCPDMLWKNWGGCATAFSLRIRSQSQHVKTAEGLIVKTDRVAIQSAQQCHLHAMFTLSGTSGRAFQPETLNLSTLEQRT